MKKGCSNKNLCEKCGKQHPTILHVDNIKLDECNEVKVAAIDESLVKFVG